MERRIPFAASCLTNGVSWISDAISIRSCGRAELTRKMEIKVLMLGQKSFLRCRKIFKN